MGPWELPETRAGMSRRNRRYFTLAHRAPLLSRAACWVWAKMALAGLRGDRDRLLQRLSKGLPPPDREVLAEVAADPQRWTRFVEDTAEAFRQGGAGVRADLAVASRPWGFQLREISVPTWLWHGAADEDMPIAAAWRMAPDDPQLPGQLHRRGAPHGAAPRQRGGRGNPRGDGSLEPTLVLAPPSSSRQPPLAGHTSAPDCFCSTL